VGDNPTRRLIVVPIIHSQEDMGRLRESVRRQHVEKHGEQRWDEHVRIVDAHWREIRKGIAGLGLDLGRVRLYQDGLPICGKERAIVADLARAGSENHSLLVDLIDGGATVEGTEAPQLLLQEYELALKMFCQRADGRAVTTEAVEEFERLGPDLLKRRDQFIAGRIAETLRPGEVGLIFLGMLHTLTPYLPPDVRVERLDGSPFTEPPRR
jgi:hypothetical protein